MNCEQRDPAECDRIDFITREFARESGMACELPLVAVMTRVDGETVHGPIPTYARAAEMLRDLTPSGWALHASATENGDALRELIRDLRTALTH